jgi:hypothetical protein
MTATQLKGRFVSCWRHAGDVYRVAVSNEDGSGGVVAMSQFEMICELGGKRPGARVEISIASFAKQPTERAA